MFLCQTAILISVLWRMLPSSGSRGDRGHRTRSRSSASKRGSSPGSSWDDEIEEETQHIKLPRRKAQSLQKRQLKHQAKAADVAQASSSKNAVDVPKPNENVEPIPREFYVTPGGRAFHASGCGSLKVKGRHVDKVTICDLCFPDDKPHFAPKKEYVLVGDIIRSLHWKCRGMH